MIVGAGTTLQKVGPVGTSDVVRALLDRKSTDLAAMLPASYNVERFKMQALAVIAKNTDLLQCNGGSIVFAVTQAAELGLDLSPSLGEGYLIPYKLKGVMTAQFMPGYRGLVKLAVKSGMVKSIESRIVYAGDEFEYEYGTTPYIRHKPNLTASHKTDEVICVYGTATLDSGEKVIEIMTLEDVANIRRRARSQNIWESDFGEMARKTVIRRLIKYIPASAGSPVIEKLQKALEVDNANFEIEEPAAADPIKMPESTEGQGDARSGANAIIDAQHEEIQSDTNNQNGAASSQKDQGTLRVKRIGQPKPTKTGGNMWSVELSEGPQMSTFKESCFRFLAAALQSGKPVKLTTKENGQYVNIEDVEYEGKWASHE